MNFIKINNNEKAAIKDKKWKNPGAKLYNQLLDSMYCEGNIPTDSKDIDDAIKNGRYIQWDSYIKETYLIAPVNNINNSPHGRTPYSRSGCKYPHHVIRDNELVLSLGGVKAAYARAKQQGIYKGEIKDHLDRHMKELGLLDKNDIHYESLIEDNFIDIESFLMESSDVDLSDDIIYSLNEKSHGNLNNLFRAAFDFDTGHMLQIVYDAKDGEITNTGRTLKGKMSDEEKEAEIADVQKNIRKTGHLDFQSKGNKVIAINDLVTKENIKNRVVRTIGIFTPGVDRYSIDVSDDLEIIKSGEFIDNFIKKYVYTIKVGEVDNVPSFKSTYWHKNAKVKPNGYTDRVKRISGSEHQNKSRGIYVNNYIANRLGEKPVGELNKSIKRKGMLISLSNTLDLICGCNHKIIECDENTKYCYELIEHFKDTINKFKTNPSLFKDIKVPLMPEDDDDPIYYVIRNDLENTIKKLQNRINHYNECIKANGDTKIENTNNLNEFKKKYIDLFTKLNGHSKIDSKIFEFDKIDAVKRYIKSKNNKDIYFKESLDDEYNDIDLFEEKSHGKLNYDYRLGYDTDTGHKILLVYSLDNIKVDYPGHAYEIGGPGNSYTKNPKYKDSKNDVTTNIRKKGNIDHSSYGQKLLAIKDLVTNKPLKEVNYVGIFRGLNDFGSNANGAKQLSADGLKKTLQSTTPFHIKVGEVETDITFKSTKIIDSFGIMAKSELSHKYGRGHKINTQVMPGIYKTPTNKDALNILKNYLDDMVTHHPVPEENIEIVDNWNNGNVQPSLQGAAKKYKITATLIQKYINETQIKLKQDPQNRFIFTKRLNRLIEVQDHLKDQGYIESTDIFTQGDFDDYAIDIPDDAYLNTEIEESFAWMDSVLYGDLFEEKKTQEEYAREHFKKKYKYDPKTSTIEVNGKRIKVNMNNNLANDDISANNHTGCINLGKNFFRLKSPERRDATLMHEIGHLRMHSVVAGMDKENPIFDKRFLSLYDMGNDFIDDLYGCKTVEEAEKRVRKKLENKYINDNLTAEELAKTKKMIDIFVKRYNVPEKFKSLNNPNFSEARYIAKKVADEYLKNLDKDNEHLDFHEIEADRYAANKTSEGTVRKALRNLHKIQRRYLSEHPNAFMIPDKKLDELIDPVVKKCEKDPKFQNMDYNAKRTFFTNELTKAVSEYMKSDEYKTLKSKNIMQDEYIRRSKALKDPILRNSPIYKESGESHSIDELDEIKTPEELLSFMNYIEYGWYNSNTGKVEGTGEDDDEGDFFNYYRLQSPDETIERGIGVCWDQVEVERKWFDDNGIDHSVFYIEIYDENSCPTHTFLTYDKDGKFYWFEHSWGNYRGIHEYDSLNDLLNDVKRKHQIQNNDNNSEVIITRIPEPKYGMNCEQYMTWARSQFELDVNNLPTSFDESLSLSSEEQLKIQNIFDSLSDEEKAVYGYGPGIDDNTCYVKIINDAYIMLDDYTDKTNESHPYPGKYVGIAASKSSRGKGITDELISSAKEDNPNDDLIAIIENDNHASINLFTRNGFILAHEKDGFSWYIFKADNSDHIYTMNNLPDKLYFASPVKLDKISGRVFMTPHIGIASIFIINRNQVMKEYFSKYSDHDITRFSYNNGYDEWNWSDDKLQKPLTMVHMTHNVPEFTQIETGSSSGFIHVIDISDIKDKLKTFVTNDPDRELIYEGEDPLKIIDIIPHTVNWEIRYDEENTLHHGKGFIESYDSNNYFDEKSHGKLKYSFRMGINKENGHLVKIVFDLNKDDVAFVGSHDDTNPVADKDQDKIINNINKTGYTDFVSKAKVLAIIDMDTNERLNSVSATGVMSGLQAFASKSLAEREKLARGEFTKLRGGQKYVVGQIEGADENGNMNWTQRHSTGTYKSTKPAKSLDDLPKFQKDPIKYGRGYHKESNEDNILNNYIESEVFFDFDSYDHNQDYTNFEEHWFNECLNNNEYTESNIRRFGSVIFENGEFFIEAEEAPPSINLDDDTETEEKDSKKIDKSDTDNSTEDSKPDDTNILDEPIDSEEETSDAPIETSNEDPTTEEPSESEPSTTEEAPSEEPVKEEEQSSEPEQKSEETPVEEPKKEEKPLSLPKQTDAAESNKNGVRRKKLYIAFIEWCKEYNNHNTFGSIFDKDVFKVSYPFIPDPMRYFYRLANPMLCVLGGQLTFFPVAELRKINSKNTQLDELLIFAATPNDLRVFNKKDNKIYRATDENGSIKLNEILGETFDLYIQKMIGKGDILNAPLEEDSDTTK